MGMYDLYGYTTTTSKFGYKVLKAFLDKAQADRRCVRGWGRGRGVIITLQGVKLQLD